MSKIKTTTLKNIPFFVFLFFPIFSPAQDFNREPSWNQYEEQTKTLTWVLTPEKQIEWIYDDSGNRIRWKDWSGTTQYTYDNNHHITESLAYDEQKTTYEYNAEGNVNKIVYPSGEQAEYTYFKEGLIETVTFQGKKTTFEYDTKKALLLKKHLPNGITTEYQYDQAKRLISIIHTKSENILIAEFGFAYDAMNNLTLVKKTTPQQEKTTSYLYDKLYRLIEVKASNGAFEKYSYDALGNRLTKEDNQGKIIYVYNDQNQLIKANDISFSYDPNGNLRVKSTPIGDIKYDFNELNQLTSYEDGDHSVKFTYNGQGERLTKTIDGQTTKYSYEDIFPVFHLLEENSENMKRNYFYSHICLGYSEDKKIYYYLEDSPGSSIGFIIDEKGNVVEEMEYDSFGKCLSDSESSLQYNGELVDQESGLVFLRTRYYDPSLGRFISSDQFPGNALQPQTLNRYVYVHNNPLNFHDPMGTYSESKTIEVKQFLWSKGVPIWENGDPLPPEGYTYVVICARKMSLMLADPNRSGKFRKPGETGGHVWIEFIDNHGNHISIGAHKGNENFVNNNPNLGQLHRDVKTTDHLDYSHDKHTIRVAKLVRNETAEIIKGGSISSISRGYNLATCNCIHAAKKGTEPQEIAEVHKLFFGLKRNFTEEEPSLSLLPHLTPSGIYSSIEHFIAPYVKIEQDRQAQVYQKAKLEEWMNWHQNSPNINMGLTKVGLGAPFTVPPRSSPTNVAPTKGNFGGICLSKKAELNLALQEVYGAVFDEATGQIYILGKKSIKLPEMPIDHLAVAFQSIYGLKGNRAEDPAISIEPISNNKMIVKYSGATFGTEFGRILFEADLTLKKLGLGLLPCSVAGFLSHLEISKILGDKNHPEFSGRTWITPEVISLRQSEDGSSMVFDQVKMRCLVENKVGNRVVTDPGHQAYADHFTNHYDAIAKQYPIFNEIKLLGQITGVVKWTKENNIPLNLSFFEIYSPIIRETPTEINSFVLNYQTSTGQSRSIEGGISFLFHANNYFVRKDEGLETFKNAVISSRPQESIFSWEMLDSKRNSISVNAFPVLHTRKVGDVRKTFVDLEFPAPGDFPLTFVRFYDSFNEQDVGFGRGWAITPFEIYITSKKRINQDGYYIDAFPVLLVREENQHWIYKVLKFDWDGRIWYTREDSMQALCENPDGTFSLFLFEKSIASFNSNGKLTEITDRNNIATKYLYKEDYLISIEHQNGKSISLFYEQDRIIQAISPQKTVTYKYDEKSQLYEVLLSDILQFSYQYDNDLRLTHILGSKEEIIFEGYYDEYNRLCSEKIGTEEIKTEYSLGKHASFISVGGVKIEEDYDSNYHLIGSKVDEKTRFERVFQEKQWIDIQYDLEGRKGWQYVYDVLGLLVEAINPSGEVWKFTYDENKQLVKRADPNGNLTKFTYDQAMRLHMKYDRIRTFNPITGKYESKVGRHNLTMFTYNELGRLETIEKEGETTLFSYDVNGILIEIIFSSGRRIKRELDENLQTRSISDSETLQTIEFDERGRITVVIEFTGRTEYFYDESDNICKIIDKCQNITEYEYNEKGILIRVKDAEDNTTKYNYTKREAI